MQKVRYKILVIFESPRNYLKLPEKLLKFSDWEDERDVVKTLTALGHKVHLQGICSDLNCFYDAVKNVEPDLIFNLCETLNKNRSFESLITGFCELLNIPYTGAKSYDLQLCCDKSIAKKILSFHQIATPDFLVTRKNSKSIGKMVLPAIVKPLSSEASEGISQRSFVKTRRECLSRVEYLHKKLNSDVIIEEYIEGSDIYIGIMGYKEVTVFEPVIIRYGKYPQKRANIATSNVKWSCAYRRRWGISVNQLKLEQNKIDKIKDYCMHIYRALNLRGYCRLDLRLSKEGEIYFIEANPNPSIAKSDEFALSAKFFGCDYMMLISKIVDHAFT